MEEHRDERAGMHGSLHAAFEPLRAAGRACSDMWERMSPQTRDSVKQRLLALLQTEPVPSIARKVRIARRVARKCS